MKAEASSFSSIRPGLNRVSGGTATNLRFPVPS